MRSSRRLWIVVAVLVFGGCGRGPNDTIVSRLAAPLPDWSTARDKELGLAGYMNEAMTNREYLDWLHNGSIDPHGDRRGTYLRVQSGFDRESAGMWYGWSFIVQYPRLRPDERAHERFGAIRGTCDDAARQASLDRDPSSRVLLGCVCVYGGRCGTARLCRMPVGLTIRASQRRGAASRRCGRSRPGVAALCVMPILPSEHMSRSFAIVLGVCFVALGLAKIFFAFDRPFIYDVIVGPLFLVTGAACFFHRDSAGHGQSK